MSLIAAISNIQAQFPPDVIAEGGTITTLSLVISLSIALLISDSKYWNKWASSTFDICVSSLFLTFIAIIILKIIILLF